MKKWEEIYYYLYELLGTLKTSEDNLLPSENFLRNKFKVSVQPIRKAYQQLINDKLVEAHHGKGYKILTKPANVLFSFNDLFPNAHNEYVYLGKVPVDEAIRNRTRFYYEDFVHEIRVKRYLTDKLFVFQVSYISDCLLKKGIDIEYIQEYGLLNFFTHNVKTITKSSLKKILSVNRQDLNYQELNEFKSDYLILDKGMLFGGNQQLIEYRESYYNYDEFEWSFTEYYR